MGTLLEALAEKEKLAAKKRRADAKKRRLVAQLIEKHIQPYMPRTLETCFALDSAYPSYQEKFGGAVMNFAPSVDMSQGAASKRAVGTVAKVAKGLERAGWRITREPEAIAREYSKDMSIVLTAARSNGNGADLTLSMHFSGIQSTDRCRLVEKEVIVAYVAEHKETRLVVECEDQNEN